ncbi:MAG: hypothetical protein KAT04_15675 [Methylococcales bacterium]|nr:hypothetical protein [Methylococcales bacterium]
MYGWHRKVLLLLLFLIPFLTTSSAWAGRNGKKWDKIPDTFTFTFTFTFVDQSDVARNSSIISNSITVSGINTSISISVSGGEYSINSGSYRSTSSTVNNGDTIKVRQTSSSQYLTTTSAVLDLNGVSDSFDITTLENTSDSTPDPFTFSDQVDVLLNTIINANSFIVSGISTSISVSITGGEYSINNGGYSSAPSSVDNGDTINVRQVSSSQFLTTTSAVLNLNGVTDSFDVTTVEDISDTTPDSFRLIDQTGVELSSAVLSNTITVTGINTATVISVIGGEFSINGGTYTSSSSTVVTDDTVTVRLAAASTYNSTTQATLTIGGVSDIFSVTTQDNPLDTTPDVFSFIDQSDVELGSVNISNAIPVSGINAATVISVSNGEYAINGGSFTTVTGEVINGNTVSLRQTAASTYQTTNNTALTIGGIVDTYSTTTIPEPTLSFQLPPQPVGDAAFNRNHFSGSDNCTQCHNNLSDNQGNDVSIETDWSATMMANSTRDPFWKAKVRTELNRNPHLADVINDKCSRCHAPMANFEAKKNNETIKILDDGFLDSSHSRHDEAMNGVSCTLCHQIQDSPKLGTVESFTGKYEIGDNKEIFGPYDNLFPNPMVMNTGFTPKYSLHIKESEMCATCHNVKTPYVDEAGTVLTTTLESEFPEQMPYSEWLHSDYTGTNSCQSCHMERANGVPISNRPMWLEERDNFAVHEFVGANTFMLTMLKNNKQQLGVIASNFDDIITATRAMLKESATIEVLSQSLNQGQLDFNLKIDSKTGHKLPSAYPSRRVIVHVTVLDDANNVVFESGKVNANGSVQGVASDFDALAFEPHYDVINSPDQVQVYEAIMGNSDDKVTYTLLRGATYLKDNRLLPNGFNKTTAPDDVAVAGIAYNDNNFIGGSDQISYRIGGLTGSSYTVKIELVYQTIAYGFVRDLFKDNSAEVNDFKKMYNESTSKTSVLTSTDFVIQ